MMAREHCLDKALRQPTAERAFGVILSGQAKERERDEQHRKWRIEARRKRKQGKL